MDNHPWWIRSIAVPLTTALVVGAGGSYMAATEAIARYDERIEAIEKKLDERPTKPQLNAVEDRARAYTDARFSEIMITLTELNATSRATADDVREIKADLREMKR